MNFEEWLDKRFPVIQTPAQKAILKEAFTAGHNEGYLSGKTIGHKEGYDARQKETDKFLEDSCYV